MVVISKGRTFLAAMVCVIGFLFALPNVLTDKQLDALPSWMPKNRVSLGLDLQGGSHLLLEVDVAAGFKDRLGFVLESVRKSLRQEKIGYVDLDMAKDGAAIEFRLRDPSQADKVRSLILKAEPELEVAVDGADHVRVGFSEKSIAQRKASLIQQMIEVVRRRIDEVGTKEPTIQAQGEDRILLQLPGISNPTQVKELLGKTAKMTFQFVYDEQSEAESLTAPAPAGTVILESRERRGDGPDAKPVYLVVRKEVILGGESLVDAGVSHDEYNRPVVSFRFDALGAKKFGAATSQNVGKRFAIVLDNQVICAPRIQQALTTGSGIITGQFTLEEASTLALLMRAGALVAPLTVLEERTVGPDLGADSIVAGKRATMLSVVMVAVFMFVAYALFGMFANIAMICNLIILIGALSLIGATLTLPGIAGIALTMGMAVDANVLINERIKEEMRLGRKMLSAIDSGYRQAMGTILDANLTTLIGAGALFFFGTGPVKGFGVTLGIGIMVSMFTAITLSRVFVNLWLNVAKPKALPI